VLEDLLKEHGGELIKSITQGSELDASQAESLLPPAFGQITDLIKGGGDGFDLGDLLGGGQGAASELLGKLDIGKIAGIAGLSEGQAQGGLQSLIPAVVSLLGDKAGGVQGLLSMLGGADTEGGAGSGLGALGGIAGKLFGKWREKEEPKMANLKIEEIEGIGPVLGEKFVGAGVKDTDGLLDAGCTKAGRKTLAETTGLSES